MHYESVTTHKVRLRGLIAELEAEEGAEQGGGGGRSYVLLHLRALQDEVGEAMGAAAGAGGGGEAAAEEAAEAVPPGRAMRGTAAPAEAGRGESQRAASQPALGVPGPVGQPAGRGPPAPGPGGAAAAVAASSLSLPIGGGFGGLPADPCGGGSVPLGLSRRDSCRLAIPSSAATREGLTSLRASARA
mmetsp:Transcript_24606/g.72852  ORF Transcript_24606/g.72852 Transcript_24606/m.72852 type:complete len:188 (-) Transcript_24606:138-701(-)